ncbi:MAG: hypothetical protein O3B96_01370, partial [bacterium]|nr:hypothetical protein [bacterium]
PDRDPGERSVLARGSEANIPYLITESRKWCFLGIHLKMLPDRDPGERSVLARGSEANIP